MLDSSKSTYRRSRSEAGFTLTELTVVMVVLGLILAPLFVVTINSFTALLARNAEALLATESQILLRTITEELRPASSVRPSATLNDPNEPPEGWSTANDNLILIISTPALTASRDLIIDPDTNLPAHNEIIYYAKDNVLFRRRLARSDLPGNATKSTCPTATPTCPADTRLTTHFKDMRFTLYDLDDAVTTDIAKARSILLTVDMYQPLAGRDARFTNKMRVTIRNIL